MTSRGSICKGSDVPCLPGCSDYPPMFISLAYPHPFRLPSICDVESIESDQEVMPMTTLSIRLFGRFCARHPELNMGALESRRVQELFCYLLLNRDHSHPRETLAGILWSNTSSAQSKANLRKMLWQLHAAIDMQHDSSQVSTLMV